jgi:hypothetical protein
MLFCCERKHCTMTDKFNRIYRMEQYANISCGLEGSFYSRRKLHMAIYRRYSDLGQWARSLRWKAMAENTVRWFIVREKYCSGWKKKQAEKVRMVRQANRANLLSSTTYCHTMIFFENYTIQRRHPQHVCAHPYKHKYANSTPMGISEELSRQIMRFTKLPQASCCWQGRCLPLKA